MFYRSIFLKLKFEPLASALEQLVCGLNIFKLVPKIKENPDVFKFLFCYSAAFSWTHELLLSKLYVQWSDAGTSNKNMELVSYKAFLEMAEQIYYDG